MSRPFGSDSRANAPKTRGEFASSDRSSTNAETCSWICAFAISRRRLEWNAFSPKLKKFDVILSSWVTPTRSRCPSKSTVVPSAANANRGAPVPRHAPKMKNSAATKAPCRI